MRHGCGRSARGLGHVPDCRQTKPTLITKANVDDPNHWGNFKK